MVSLLIVDGVSDAQRRQDPKQRVHRQQPAATPTSYTLSRQNATFRWLDRYLAPDHPAWSLLYTLTDMLYLGHGT